MVMLTDLFSLIQLESIVTPSSMLRNKCSIKSDIPVSALFP